MYTITRIIKYYIISSVLGSHLDFRNGYPAAIPILQYVYIYLVYDCVVSGIRVWRIYEKYIISLRRVWRES